MKDERGEQLRKEFSDAVQGRKTQFMNGLTGERKKLIEEITKVDWYGWSYSSRYAVDLLEGLNSGKYDKPSSFIKRELEWIFPGYIYPRFKEALYYAVDHCNEWTYSTSHYRRSFRARTYYLERILHVICAFHAELTIDADLADVLSLKLPEKERAYLLLSSSQGGLGHCPELIAYELDMRNGKVEEALTDIINGDSEVTFHRNFIRGIVQSNNESMYRQLGKLLLAARLQEGLRQSICEEMDMGTVSAFRSLLGVVGEQNLIRYSSVKRAVGTWLGLIAPDSGDLDRISDKSIQDIIYVLEDSGHIEEYLATEDSMKIYIALWGIAVYDVQQATKRVIEISRSGTRHQLLTAGYFCANLDNTAFEHDLAKKIIREHSGEYDILAVYMTYFMGDWDRHARRKENRHKLTLERYFTGKQEAESYYQLLQDIYEQIPKKSLDFSPCIFPWYSASLTKSQLVERMCVTAKILEDNEKLDESCKRIAECDISTRSACMAYTLEQPATKVQRSVLTEMLCNKESYTRDKAKEIAKEVVFDEDNYRQMEGMLKYKAADMRETLISLLYRQEDEKLLATIKRLLAEPKEEKRTAGLDLVMQVVQDGSKEKIKQTCMEAVGNLENVTAKEQILVDNILGQSHAGSVSENTTSALYRQEDAYVPQIQKTDFIGKGMEVFLSYFPDSKIINEANGTLKAMASGVGDSLKAMVSGIGASKENGGAGAKADCMSLHDFFVQHELDEFKGDGGETCTLGAGMSHFREWKGDYRYEVPPCLALWKEWYEQHVNDPKRLYRMYILLSARDESTEFQQAMLPFITHIFGPGYEIPLTLKYQYQLLAIVERLMKDYINETELTYLSAALAYWYITCLPQKKVLLPFKGEEVHFITHKQLSHLFCHVNDKAGAFFDERFPLTVAVTNKTFAREPKYSQEQRYIDRYRLRSPYGYLGYAYGNTFSKPAVRSYLIAACHGIMTQAAMYEYLFRKENLREAVSTISLLGSGIREQGRSVAGRSHIGRWRLNHRKNDIRNLLGRDVNDESELTAEEQELLDFVAQVYETVITIVLERELRRGDSETEYSGCIGSIARIYGMNYFIMILKALGKDKLERSTYFSSESKKGCLSHLLSVCIPVEGDSAEKLSGMLTGTGITEERLIEAALYSPEWMDIIGGYLQWEGFTSACYYFMAHMNEEFDDVRKAVIAKYTPLSEEELKAGAFDIQWFRSAYDTLGEKRFNLVYDAAKYISDGSKHARARKYADAVLGKWNREEVEQAISEKRNKDLVMAYSLIPIENEADVVGRYLFLQDFLKGSKKFGAQRIASEKLAVETALSNLASSAGFSDVTRLTLQMETKMIDEIRDLFEETVIEEISVRLQVMEDGKPEILCTRNGKTLKSIPAKYKKHEHVVRLSEAKKKLTDQAKRTKIMFEQAMEDETVFTVEEIMGLYQNPTAYPVVKSLLFKWEDRIGFLDSYKLIDYAGKEVSCKAETKMTVAHPFHIYQDGHWSDYQKLLCEKQIAQSFKQVFRELYVKTGEELEMEYSRRYSGHQVQPKKTVACLKTRRWVADVEDGLQKVYYKENIIARIYALADWFTPADIEAPTLEWVEFSDRKTGKRMKIGDIPDVIFSEVMRDVDLAVSVAHAGGVDPETSHSTIEMRAALLTYTLPLFKLTNVAISGSHAVVTGTYGTYTVHLGSGIIHKQGGTMINVLPVHSQHRGRLFLPFADDDPKTAEIMTKVILFAEDKKIKDPMILQQIK